jgi:hypothetical protein
MQDLPFRTSIVLLLLTITLYALRRSFRRLLMRRPTEHRVMPVIWRWVLLPDLPFLTAAAAYLIVSAAAGGDLRTVRVLVFFAAAVSVLGDLRVALVAFAASKAERQRSLAAGHGHEIDDQG